MAARLAARALPSSACDCGTAKPGPAGEEETTARTTPPTRRDDTYCPSTERVPTSLGLAGSDRSKTRMVDRGSKGWGIESPCPSLGGEVAPSSAPYLGTPEPSTTSLRPAISRPEARSVGDSAMVARERGAAPDRSTTWTLPSFCSDT